jgi:hypothetical protein
MICATMAARWADEIGDADGSFVGLLVPAVVVACLLWVVWSMALRPMLTAAVAEIDTRGPPSTDNEIVRGATLDPELLTNGTPAEATVVAATETMRVGDKTVMRLILDVQRIAGTEYRSGEATTHRVETRLIVPILQLDRVQQGAIVAVRVHPGDASKVAVVL